MARPLKYEVEVIAAVLEARAKGRSFVWIAAEISQSFDIELTAEAARHITRKHRAEIPAEPVPADVEALKAIRRTTKANSAVRRDNLAILDHLNLQADIMAKISEAVTTLNKRPAVKLRTRKAKGKTCMTIEAMLSDIHVGKKTNDFNAEVCRLRLREYTKVLIGEVERNSKNFHVEHIVVAFIGDLIENALMHGRESQAVCEFNNPEQVRASIEIFTEEIIEPIARLGIPVTVVGITGNHDREAERPTYNSPGKNGLAWIIYKAMEMLTKAAGYKHVKWVIPEGVYAILDIYGDHILYEHGEHIKGGNTKKGYCKQMMDRSHQNGVLIKGIRVGHWHEYACYDNGQVIVNASVCGQDSYAEVNGYTSNAGQSINFYVKTANRQSSFYHSFLVQLGNQQ